MTTMKQVWRSLLPPGEDAWQRGQASLVVVACLGVAAAAWGLVLAWLVSGDLEWETAVASLVFTLLLVGLLAVNRRRPSLALWLLVSLLLLLITLDVSSYGLGEPGAAAFFLPLALAACGLGLRAGLVTAGVSTAVVWLTAVGAALNWYMPETAYQESHLTFTAPFFTVLFWVVALMIGYWVQFLRTLGNSKREPFRM